MNREWARMHANEFSAILGWAVKPFPRKQECLGAAKFISVYSRFNALLVVVLGRGFGLDGKSLRRFTLGLWSELSHMRASTGLMRQRIGESPPDSVGTAGC